MSNWWYTGELLVINCWWRLISWFLMANEGSAHNGSAHQFFEMPEPKPSSALGSVCIASVPHHYFWWSFCIRLWILVICPWLSVSIISYYWLVFVTISQMIDHYIGNEIKNESVTSHPQSNAAFSFVSHGRWGFGASGVVFERIPFFHHSFSTRGCRNLLPLLLNQLFVICGVLVVGGRDY